MQVMVTFIVDAFATARIIHTQSSKKKNEMNKKGICKQVQQYLHMIMLSMLRQSKFD